jgi:ABC-type transporter Mla maintaining outer membrane lipid asymmetry ATPase subunit MlaF
LKEKRKIIDNVSGNVMPGQFLAIIGASGKYLVVEDFRCWKNHTS